MNTDGDLSAKHRRERRTVLWLCIAGLILSYALGFTLKAFELTPPAFTWTFAILVPLAVFTPIGGLALMSQGGRITGMAFLAGSAMFSWSLWLICASLFGSPERLFNLANHDRNLLAKHDRLIETLKSNLAHISNRGEGLFDPQLQVLESQRPYVKLLWEERVARAREKDRRDGYDCLASGLALLAWSIRRRKRARQGSGAVESGRPDRGAQPEGMPERQAQYVTPRNEPAHLPDDCCLVCGAAMPEGASECPSCRWTYNTQATRPREEVAGGG